MSRNTVVRAYEDLEGHGLVTRRQGSGTLVAAAVVSHGGQPAELSAVIQRNVIGRLVADGGPESIDFLGAHAPAPSEVDSLITAAIENVDIRSSLQLPGYFPLGLPALRDAIAERLTARGAGTSSDQILITSGAQQGISLVAAALIRAKRNVVLEDPTFAGAIDCFRVAGARLRSVGVVENGADVEQLTALTDEIDVAFAYLMPNHQNPTGVVMPLDSRPRVAQLAETTGLVLVEDDALAELDVDGAAPTPIASLTKSGIVLSIGSLSKLFWGGLRIGWIRGPKEMIAHLGHIKAIADLGTSVVSQVVALDLIRQADEAQRIRRSEIRAALDRLERLLPEYLPGSAWRRPAGGLSVWVRLPYGSATELARVAQAEGVAIVPGPVMSATGGWDDHVRLPIGRTEETMTEGLRRLGSAWTRYSKGPVVARRNLRIVV